MTALHFSFKNDTDTKLLAPTFNFEALKSHVTSSLISATEHAVMNCRDLIGGCNSSHFEFVIFFIFS